MGLRFRRSVKICKGLRVNFNKNSWGISVGSRGYGYSFNSKGRRTKHIGIPGTGLSYVTSTSTKKNYNKLIILFRNEKEAKTPIDEQ